MKKQVNRSICLAQWKNGDNTFAMSRFIWENGKLVKHLYFYTNKLTLSSVNRINAILENYKGGGVMVSQNEERTMLTQSWDDKYMIGGEIADRDEFKTFEDMMLFFSPYVMIKGVCHVR